MSDAVVRALDILDPYGGFQADYAATTQRAAVIDKLLVPYGADGGAPAGEAHLDHTRLLGAAAHVGHRDERGEALAGAEEADRRADDRDGVSAPRPEWPCAPQERRVFWIADRRAAHH